MSTAPTTPTADPLDAIRAAYQGTLAEWVGPAVKDQEPCDREFWAQCVADVSAATDHAREAMAATERGDLQAASDHALKACSRARPFGLNWTSPLHQLYDAIRAAIGLSAIREAYWLTQGARTGGDWVATVQAADRAREAMAAVERAALTEWGAPCERRGMATAEDLAWLAVDAAQRGEPESAASYSHFYRTIRGVVKNQPPTPNP